MSAIVGTSSKAGKVVQADARVQAAVPRWKRLVLGALVFGVTSAGCQYGSEKPSGQTPGLKVMAAESFLAEIAQNVAGNRATIGTLVPRGVDPHAFEPTPRDMSRAADAQLLIVNGAGLEAFLDRLSGALPVTQTLVVASTGLKSRLAGEDEEGAQHEDQEDHGDVDPHFWLDPLNVLTYVDNIRAALSAADPPGAAIYQENAAAYSAKLRELDLWIQSQVVLIPPDQRILVTNHLSFGYFADRYGFRVLGTILPGASTAAEPSAKALVGLTEQIRQTGAKAIFLETGSQTDLAAQIAREAGILLVEGLHTHSVTDAEGTAPTYLDMMRHNVSAIVSALK